MLLPNAEQAEIDPNKLHGYLLAESHPIGRFKARFFRALGYSADRWQELEVGLRVQHLTQEARLSEVTPHGHAYEIRAPLIGPSGQSALVISVWFIAVGQDTPHFVTAYPGDPL